MLQAMELEASWLDMTLPILGMRSLSCARRLEANLLAVRGVGRVVVRLASEQAEIRLDRERTEFTAIAAAVEAAGCRLATTAFSFALAGMTCRLEASRVKRALSDVPGVLTVRVDHAEGLAEVEAIKDAVRSAQLQAAIRAAGFAISAAPTSAATDGADAGPHEPAVPIRPRRSVARSTYGLVTGMPSSRPAYPAHHAR